MSDHIVFNYIWERMEIFNELNCYERLDAWVSHVRQARSLHTPTDERKRKRRKKKGGEKKNFNQSAGRMALASLVDGSEEINTLCIYGMLLQQRCNLAETWVV